MNTIFWHMMLRPRIMDPRNLVKVDTIDTAPAEDLAQPEGVPLETADDKEAKE